MIGSEGCQILPLLMMVVLFVSVGLFLFSLPSFPPPPHLLSGMQIAENIKKHFDETWAPHWHVVLGKNFGSFVHHETKRYVYFYLNDKAVMIYKAG